MPATTLTPTKLTVRLLERLKPEERVSDTEVPGLYVEVGKTGTARFKYKTELREGDRRGEKRKGSTFKRTLGTYPEMSLEDARREAARMRLRARDGENPDPSRVVSEEVWTVDKLIHEYVADREQAGRAESTREDIIKRYESYLDTDLTFEVEDPQTKTKRKKQQNAWGRLSLAGVTDDVARDRHKGITVNHGPVVANDTLRNFRAAWNWAKKTRKGLGLGDNPVEGVTFNRQRQRTEVLVFPDLKDWAKRVKALENPLRREMHMLGLFSGLRPGVLVQLERAWVIFAERVLRIPADRMKKRRAHDLPLSEVMMEIIERAMVAGDVMYPGAPFLFASRAKKDRSGPVVATASWHDRTLESETGYVLRHLYSNAASAAYVDKAHRMLLLGQKVPGIEGTYLNDRYLFDTLLREQEKVSAYLTKAIG